MKIRKMSDDIEDIKWKTLWVIVSTTGNLSIASKFMNKSNLK